MLRRHLSSRALAAIGCALFAVECPTRAQFFIGNSPSRNVGSAAPAYIGNPPTNFGGPPTNIGNPPTNIGNPPTNIGNPPGFLGNPPGLIGNPPHFFGITPGMTGGPSGNIGTTPTGNPGFVPGTPITRPGLLGPGT